MSKIIFTSGVNPEYDDIPEVRCEFPRRYLKMVEDAVGDWVIYYEPRKNGGRMSYYASARVVKLETHPLNRDHFYMYVTDYIEFVNPVSFRDEAHFYERALRRDDGKPNQGALGWSVRRLPEEEFSLILQKGFGEMPAIEPLEASVNEAIAEYGRPVVPQLVNRPLRGKVFSRIIHSAYDQTCAFTGLHLSNGEGLFEAEVAHIRAVKDHGPDSPRNGLALTQTIHWLFDEGVLSLENDGRILQAGRLV